MRYDKSRATVEASLAKAHRAIVAARVAADGTNDHHLYLDLQMLEVEITRLAENSLRGKARMRVVGQTSIYDAVSNGP